MAKRQEYELEPLGRSSLNKARKPVNYRPIPYHRRVEHFKHQVPFWVAILIVLTLVALFCTAYFLFLRLPRGLDLSDEEHHPNRFIAERAAGHIKNLTDFGSRVAGTYNNEVLTMNLLLSEIDKIRMVAHTTNLIEVDHQTANGSYYRDKRKYPQLNVYRGVQNIVVKLDKKNQLDSDNYILLNAHVDTTVMSPGELLCVLVIVIPAHCTF